MARFCKKDEINNEVNKPQYKHNFFNISTISPDPASKRETVTTVHFKSKGNITSGYSQALEGKVCLNKIPGACTVHVNMFVTHFHNRFSIFQGQSVTENQVTQLCVENITSGHPTMMVNTRKRLGLIINNISLFHSIMLKWYSMVKW